jgi:hypothetical protein
MPFKTILVPTKVEQRYRNKSGYQKELVLVTISSQIEKLVSVKTHKPSIHIPTDCCRGI